MEDRAKSENDVLKKLQIIDKSYFQITWKHLFTNATLKKNLRHWFAWMF
jgi:hypothetical protein